MAPLASTGNIALDAKLAQLRQQQQQLFKEQSEARARGLIGVQQ